MNEKSTHISFRVAKEITRAIDSQVEERRTPSDMYFSRTRWIREAIFDYLGMPVFNFTPGDNEEGTTQISFRAEKALIEKIDQEVELRIKEYNEKYSRAEWVREAVIKKIKGKKHID